MWYNAQDGHSTTRASLPTASSLSTREGRGSHLPVRRKKGKLVPKEDVAVKAVVKQGLSVEKALEKAGYANPAEEKDRFLARPVVRDAIIEEQQQELISWHILKSKCKKLIYNVINLAVDSKDPRLLKVGISAAREVFGTLRKTDPKALTDAAEIEDRKDEPIETLVSRILDGDLVPRIEGPKGEQ